MSVITKRGAMEKIVIIVLLYGRVSQNKVIRRPGNKKKVMSPGVPGGRGLGVEQFDRCITNSKVSVNFCKIVSQIKNSIKFHFLVLE